jgi:hypothetical protein
VAFNIKKLKNMTYLADKPSIARRTGLDTVPSAALALKVGSWKRL